MKLIIAGSRTITKLSSYWVRDTLNQLGIDHENADVITEVVSGTAGGVDTIGEKFAKKYLIPIKQFPADWDNKGRGAGHIRNAEMGKYADALLLIWDGQSKGSASMKAIMEKLKKPVYEVIIK
jgi:hypothetical protein